MFAEVLWKRRYNPQARCRGGYGEPSPDATQDKKRMVPWSEESKLGTAQAPLSTAALPSLKSLPRWR
jgi:hypothetical protein